MYRVVNIVILSMLNVLKSLVLVVTAYFSKLLIDAATAKGNYLPYFYTLIGLVLFGIILYIVFAYIRSRFSLKVEVETKQKIFTALIHKDINALKKFHSGEISTVYMSDVIHYRNGVCILIPDICLYASRFIFALIYLIIFKPEILFFLSILGIFCVIGAFFYSRYMKKFHRKAIESDAKLNAFMQESYQNLRYVQAMDSKGRIKDRSEELSLENKKIKNIRNIISIFGNTGFYSLLRGTYAITMLYGAYCLFEGLIGYGTLMSLVQIVSYFESPLSMVSSLFNQYASYQVSRDRINELLNLKDDEEQINISSFDKIVFEHVDFGYQDKLIIKDLNIEINQGETIILKGPSGKGKTTIFKLLLGFINPVNGQINVYHDGKVNKIENCRNLFSYVPQENILFSGTIENNFRLLLDHYNEEELEEALKFTFIDEEINKNREGISTKLTERGEGLSLGQIQRVLLSIAYLKRRPILLLDEFTSSLDKSLEKEIVNNVIKLNCTKVIITHRDIKIDNARVIDLGDIDE